MGGSPQGTGTYAPATALLQTARSPATALPFLRPPCLGLRCSARNRPTRSRRTQPPHPQSPHTAAPITCNLPALFLHTACLDALYSGACSSTWRGAEGKCRCGFPQEQQRSTGEARKENSKTPGTVRAQSASFPGVSIVFERASCGSLRRGPSTGTSPPHPAPHEKRAAARKQQLLHLFLRLSKF